MGIELSITYEGNEPGLAEHRLSLAGFAVPLSHLLSALQRTASAILSSALDDPEYGSRGGKFAKEAALLDLELGTIGEGSAAPAFAVVVRSDRRARQITLAIDDLPERAIRKLVNDIDAESRGVLQNASARRYLKSIPPGVKRQIYLAAKDGVVLARAEFGEAKIGTLPEDAPRLLRLYGHVVAIGFEPGSLFVTLRTEQGTNKYAATSAAVDQALSLRGRDVIAAALVAQDSRLMWVRSAEAPHAGPSMADSLAHLEKRWDKTLSVLGQ